MKEYDKSESKFNERKAMIADMILNNNMYVPMKAKEIASLLQVPRDERHVLQEVLDALVKEGTIDISKKGKYKKPDKNRVVGVYESTRKGFGFVRVEGRENDIFISSENTNHAFYMDKVLVAIIEEEAPGRKAEGKIIDIIEHQVTTVVGTYQQNGNYGFVIPDNTKILYDIFIPQGKSLHAVNGHKVVALICDYSKGQKNPEGVVTEIIGHINDPGTDIMSIVKSFEIDKVNIKIIQCA